MNMSKITATQKVIRNKFKKAYTNRLEREHDVNSAMKPLTTTTLITSDLESKNNDFALRNRNLSKTTNNSPRLYLTSKGYSNRAIKSKQNKPMSNRKNKEKHHDPNKLCDSLRILLSSSQHTGDMKCLQQISIILNMLRELKIIV